MRETSPEFTAKPEVSEKRDGIDQLFDITDSYLQRTDISFDVLADLYDDFVQFEDLLTLDGRLDRLRFRINSYKQRLHDAMMRYVES